MNVPGGTGTAGGAPHEVSPAALTCPICQGAIEPPSYWCAVFLDPGTLAHILCLWALQDPFDE